MKILSKLTLLIALTLTSQIVPMQAPSLWQMTKNGASSIYGTAGKMVRASGHAADSVARASGRAAQSAASVTWDATKAVANKSGKYASGISKIALGTGLLGFAAAETLLLKNNWNAIMLAQNGLVTGAAVSKLLTDTIDRNILLSAGSSVLVTGGAAAVFLLCTTLGSTLTVKGVRDVWKA